jgi:hypothetical protein
MAREIIAAVVGEEFMPKWSDVPHMVIALFGILAIWGGLKLFGFVLSLLH